MALDITTIEKALVAIVKTILTTDEVIIARQNAPRPVIPYTSVYIVNVLSAGIEESRFSNQLAPDVDLIETVIAQRQIFTSFNFYYDESRYRANRFRLLLNSSTILSMLRAAGLGLGIKSGIRELNGEQDKQIEERAQLDITFHVIDSEDIVTRTITSTHVEGEYQEAGKSIDIVIDTP